MARTKLLYKLGQYKSFLPSSSCRDGTWVRGGCIRKGAGWIRKGLCLPAPGVFPDIKQRWEGFQSWKGPLGMRLEPRCPDPSTRITGASPGIPQADESAGGRARPDLGTPSEIPHPPPRQSQPPGQANRAHSLVSWLQVCLLTFLRQERSTIWFYIVKTSIIHQLMYGLSKQIITAKWVQIKIQRFFWKLRKWI